MMIESLNILQLYIVFEALNLKIITRSLSCFDKQLKVKNLIISRFSLNLKF